MTEIIIRSYQGAPTLSGRKINGYAIVFNQQSELLYEGGRRFREIILPSAVTMAMLDHCDIRALLEHDPARLLARSNKGQGTLSYSIDSYGIKFSFEAPHTSDGDFAVEMIKRGDITGCSFAFSLAKGGDRWRETKSGIWERTIMAIGYVSDFSIVSSPAYSGTSADVRSRKDRKLSKIQMAKNRLALMEAITTEVNARRRFLEGEAFQQSINKLVEHRKWDEQNELEMNELNAKYKALSKRPKKHPDSLHWWE
jgi:HK97 family phage prohead protease